MTPSTSPRGPRPVPALLLAAALLATGACDDLQRHRPTASTEVLNHIEGQLGGATTKIDTSMTAALSSAFRAAAAKALPAVVQVTVTQRTMRTPRGFLQSAEDPEPVAQIGQAFGSGFVIDADGRILTNNHVIDDAVEVRVKLSDGRDYSADVIGGDEDTDVALIQIRPDRDGPPLPVAELGNSDALRVGDWVLALGNPLSLNFTVTAGIVSAKNRTNILRDRATALESFIQTDAAINPGNSGGPLVDLRGRVVGINTAIESQTGFYSGASFAIPIDLAQKVALDLAKYGVVHRPRLGITISDVNAADAELYKLPAVTGVEITSVSEGEPADLAGLTLGDVVITVNDQRVNSSSELQTRIAALQPGSSVNIGFIRYGKPLETSVRLGAFEQPPRAHQPELSARRNGSVLGFQAEPLPARFAKRLNIEPNAPVVSDIDPFGPAGPAAGVGLLPGHVIRSLNGRTIRTMSDLRRAAATVQPGDIVSLVVIDVRTLPPVPTIVNNRIH
jgi:serine protease Do